jgi:predicted MFS family arabinose efflux permease
MSVGTADKTISLEKLYRFITGEDEEGRVCEAIPAEGCSDVPGNFFLNVLNGSATKLGDQLGSPSLVLPWFLDALGAPAALSGLLVPLRRSLALLPQLAIAGRIRRFKKRKWFWAGGGFVFGLAFLLMVPAALIPSATFAGIAVVSLLAIASLARGVSSVAFKDVLAKTIPEGRRGTLLAMRATSAGILTLCAGLLLRSYLAEKSSVLPFLLLLGITAILWFIGASLAAAVDEKEGATSGSRNALEEARSGLKLVRSRSGFRGFIIARALLLSVSLAIPFYTLYARQLTDGKVGGLSLFVIAIALAEVLSSPIWGRFSDRSSRKVMMSGGALAVCAGAGALALGSLPASLHTPFALAPVFLVAGFAQAGVRLGRKTYLVDGAPEEERPLYVAVSNTLIGVLTLTSSVFGLIAQAFGVRILLFIFLALIVLGVGMCWRMPEAERMADE